MDPVAFLRHLFPKEGVQGFMRIVTVNQGNWPGKTKWVHTELLHDDNYDLHISPALDTYFTPHLYKEQGEAEKVNAHAHAQALWMDCDDVGWAPWMVHEATPSFVVETSPRKYHGYWLLDQPESAVQVEEFNRRLAHLYLKRDRSGWDLSQLLRLPGSFSHKYDSPFKVDVLDAWNKAEHRLPLSRFAGLPETTRAQIDLDCLEIPDQLPEPQEVRDQFQDLISEDLQKLIERRAGDRSRALWSLYHMCKRIGMTMEQVYVIALTSQNNKFEDQKYNGDRQLWRDVVAAFRCDVYDDGMHIQEKIDHIMYIAKMKADQKKKTIAGLIYDDMFSKGRFFCAPSTYECFYYRDKCMYPLHSRSESTATLLNLQYGVNASLSLYDFVREHLRTRAETLGMKVQMKDRFFYDAETNLLFVSNHKGDAWRLDGTTLQLVDNGFGNGVFFRPVDGSQPFDPNFESEGLLEKYVFNLPKFDPSERSVEDAKFIVKSWLCALFFPEIMETRPILVVEGPKGSGKTTLFKAFEWVLSGSLGSVTEMPQDPDEFKETIRNKNYVFFDGVDLTFKGLRNLLSTAATGTIQVKRRLYTDDMMVRHYLKCFLGITTMEAKFFRDDVADRSLPLKAARLTVNRSEEGIRNDVLTHRNEIWGELLVTLNGIVKQFQLKKYTDEVYNFRMADFAIILSALCDLELRDSKYFIKSLRHSQIAQVLNRDPLFESLLHWLRIPSNRGRKIDSVDLHKELYALSTREGIPYARTISTPRQLLFALRKIIIELEVDYIVTFVKDYSRPDQKIVLKIVPRTPEAEEAEGHQGHQYAPSSLL